jgi:hypothetical protein
VLIGDYGLQSCKADSLTAAVGSRGGSDAKFCKGGRCKVVVGARQ